MMSKNILFIIPPYFNIQDYISNDKESSLPVFTIPYGVLSLESYIRLNAHCPVNIELLDLNIEIYKIAKKINALDEYMDKLISEKLKKNFDIVAISVLFNSCYNYIGNILYSIKNRANQPLAVIGGGVATNLYKNILEDFPLLDGLCFSEGEIPMTDLINSDDYINTMNNHPSWATRNAIEVGKIPIASYVDNLDDIPIFTYDIVNLDDYNKRSADIYNINKKDKKELTIHTSRGCPFKCVYCANASLHGNVVRYMSVDRVIAEVDTMIERFNMNVLFIEDDHFLGNKNRAVEILKKLSDRNIAIEFLNGIAVYAIDDEIGFWLKKAGATTVHLAVESGSDYVLKELINKPLRKNKIKKAVDILRKNGIRVHAFIVLGIPGEMDEHRAETMKMIKEVGFDWVLFFIAIPIVGSRLYDICIKNDYLLEKDFTNHLISKGAIKAPGVDPEKIKQTAYLMNLETNFINNYNMLSGNYEVSILYFQKIVQKYPNHALAHYALSICYGLSGKDIESANKHADTFRKIIEDDPDWRFYARYFGIDRFAE